MKNWKFAALLNTPLGVVVVVGAVVLGTELLFMAVLHEFLMVQFKLPDTAWDVIDAVTLAAAISPVLYFLVFRKIQEGEQRFRQINSSAQDAIVIVNEQARITDWNLAAQKMFQYSREEAVGQQLHQLIAPPRFHADAECGFARFRETGAGPVIGKTIEISALRKDGNEFPVELSISPVKVQGLWHAMGVIRDITARKKAEETLQVQHTELEMQNEELRRVRVEQEVSQARYVDLYDLAPLGYCTVASETGLILQANLTAAAMLGVVRGALIKQQIAHFILPEDQDIYYLFHKKLFKLGELQSCEVRMVKNDGTQFWASLLATATQDEDGALVARVALSDITGRKRVEEKLNASEQKFMQFFMQISIPLGVVNKDGVILYFNDRFTHVFGYTTDDVPTLKEYWQLVYPDESYRQWVMDSWGAAVAKAAKEGTDIEPAEYRMTCKSGTERMVMIGGIHLEDNILATFIDITERKQAEDALRNSEEQYRTMIESSNDMIWTLTADGRFTFINQQAADVTGRSIEDWLGKTFEPLVVEEDLPMALEIHGKVMSGEKIHYEVRVKKTDGGILTLSANASPIFKDGKVSGTISFASDITQRKLAEAQLAEHVEELRRWHDITMGREMRTIELKREVNELLGQAGQPPRYPSAEQSNAE